MKIIATLLGFVLTASLVASDDWDEIDFDSSEKVLWAGRSISKVQFVDVPQHYPTDALPRQMRCSRKHDGKEFFCTVLHPSHFELIDAEVVCDPNDNNLCLLRSKLKLKETEAVLMSQMASLIFRSKGSESQDLATSRMQAECYGNLNAECAANIQPTSIYCLNSNYGTHLYPSWSCHAKLLSSKYDKYKLYNTTVICEGYLSLDDQFKKKDACLLRYSWMTISEIKEEVKRKSQPTPASNQNKFLQKLKDLPIGLILSLTGLTLILGGLYYWKTRLANPGIVKKKRT
eukprot:TRINITY_DN6684_c0_g2_i1.p1 TRINITY_DN6684_c0_g2~~TRINITY_DN6684_c0_g2_i1.p1  ORF type:complete len:288 (-),score=42.08 TRINITY_DN6684_c0_g2_i1:187-1050(-)